MPWFHSMNYHIIVNALYHMCLLTRNVSVRRWQPIYYFEAMKLRFAEDKLE